MPSKLKASYDSKSQATAYVEKDAGNKTEIETKDRENNIVKEEGATENMLSILNTTLALVDKEVVQNTHSKCLFIKGTNKH